MLSPLRFALLAQLALLAAVCAAVPQYCAVVGLLLVEQGARRDVSAIVASLAESRNRMGALHLEQQESHFDSRYRHGNTNADHGGVVLFPAGVGTRWYALTWDNPVPEIVKRYSPAGWLSCKSLRRGVLVKEWAVPVGYTEAGAGRTTPHPKALNAYGGSGTLAQILASYGRRADLKAHSKAIYALEAIKPFAWYDFVIPTGQYGNGFIGTDGSVVSTYRVEAPDSSVSFPRFGPNPVCPEEVAWIKSHQAQGNAPLRSWHGLRPGGTPLLLQREGQGSWVRGPETTAAAEERP